MRPSIRLSDDADDFDFDRVFLLGFAAVDGLDNEAWVPVYIGRIAARVRAVAVGI